MKFWRFNDRLFMNLHNVCSRPVTPLISSSVCDGFLEDEIIFERCCLRWVKKISCSVKRIEAHKFRNQSAQFLRAAKLLTRWRRECTGRGDIFHTRRTSMSNWNRVRNVARTPLANKILWAPLRVRVCARACSISFCKCFLLFSTLQSE